MVRVLILEDDQVAQKVWQSRIRQLIPNAEILLLPSVDQLAIDVGVIDNIGNNFDIIISDIFLSGEKTGLEFISQQSAEVQRKAIITSSVTHENFDHFSKDHGLKCQFVQKPLSQKVVYDVLLRVIRMQEKPIQIIPPEENVRDIQSHAKLKELPVYFITGCSSGVGAAIARKLVAKADCRVVLTARAKSVRILKDKFQEDSRVMILPLDVADVHQIRKAVLSVLRRWGRIDVLINNAGVCYRSVVEQMDIESEEIQMRTNYIGPAALIRSVISVMRENGQGRIINISSVSGVMGMPTMGSYTASKHALEGLSEALWYEMRPFGVHVSVVRPGFINNEGHTHVASANKAQIAEALQGPYAGFYTFMRPFVATLMRFSPQTSENIADKVLGVVNAKNPPLWVNATLDAHVFSLMRWILPESIFHRLMNFFFLTAWSYSGKRNVKAKAKQQQSA